MGTRKRRRRSRHAKKYLLQHKTSMIGISAVIVMLAVILAVGSVSQWKKIKERKAQQAEIEAQLKKEQERREELDEQEEYYGTDEYVEDVAKDALGLINPGEILFQPEP